MKGRWNDQIQCAAFSVSSIDSVHSLKGSVMRWGWHLKVVTERLAATRGGWSRASAARTWQARARLCRLTRLLGWARQSSSAVTSRVYGKFSIRAGRPVLMHHMVSITPCAQILAWLTRCWVIQLKQGSPRFASDQDCSHKHAEVGEKFTSELLNIWYRLIERTNTHTPQSW